MIYLNGKLTVTVKIFALHFFLCLPSAEVFNVTGANLSVGKFLRKDGRVHGLRQLGQRPPEENDKNKVVL